MAACNSCKAEGSRTRSVLRDGEFVDECPKCKPESFAEKFAAPSDRRGWMGFEAYADKYTKKTAPDGNDLYVASDELRADTEDWMANAGKEEETLALNKALERKRRNRRTTPLSRVEIEQARNAIRAMQQKAN